MIPRFATAAMDTMSGYGPLIGLGHFVCSQDLWSPIRSRLYFEQATHCEKPAEAILDLGVGILAGCETVAQVNTTIRSDPLLAQAWGRAAFHEQSTIARVLDVCTDEQVQQMRAANEALLRWTGRIYHHNFGQDWLRLDLDLTGLLASARAEGSEKGYFAGKKMLVAANWLGSMP